MFYLRPPKVDQIPPDFWPQQSGSTQRIFVRQLKHIAFRLNAVSKKRHIDGLDTEVCFFVLVATSSFFIIPQASVYISK